MARLQEEMSKLVSTVDSEAGPEGPATAEDLSRMTQELDAFTERMEAEGVQPEDLLKAILGEDAANSIVPAAKAERDQDETKGESSSSAKVEKEEESGKKGTTSTFEDTIRRTMARMEASDANATEATHTSSTEEEDMLAKLLKAVESGGGDGDEGDMSKMFVGMMEQLTNKDMLYEPMKELDGKFPEYLKKNGSKIPAADFTRYSNQQRIVKNIVNKFEERGYSDEDAGCRAYIWERMQAMQAEGSPPEDLIANPFPGMGVPGLGGGGGEGEGEGEDVGCPPQ
jgi:peroxin-19